MANNFKEFEIQGNVEYLDRVLDFLSKNAKFKSKMKLVDRYFVPAHRNFLDKKPVQEWLRLRNADGKQSITYKRWHYNEKNEGLFADEFESVVGSVDNLQKIFEALNFKEILVLDKVRSVWEYENYEVALDEIEGLKPLIEVEYCAESDDHEKANKEMIKFLKKAGAGKIRLNYSGAPIMMLYPDEVKYVEF